MKELRAASLRAECKNPFSANALLTVKMAERRQVMPDALPVSGQSSQPQTFTPVSRTQALHAEKKSMPDICGKWNFGMWKDSMPTGLRRHGHVTFQHLEACNSI